MIRPMSGLAALAEQMELLSSNLNSFLLNSLRFLLNVVKTFNIAFIACIICAKVRKNTPRLLEPKGEREVVKASLYLCLFWEILQQLCRNTKRCFVWCYYSRTANFLQWKLYAKTGDTTRQVFYSI